MPGTDFRDPGCEKGFSHQPKKGLSHRQKMNYRTDPMILGQTGIPRTRCGGRFLSSKQLPGPSLFMATDGAAVIETIALSSFSIRTDDGFHRPGVSPAVKLLNSEDLIMTTKRHSIGVLVAGAGVLLLSACVLREEKITVARDGSVLIELEITGTEEELASGDAMPSEQSGWPVERSIEKDDGKERVVLRTKRRFASDEELPRSFAASGDPDTDLYLEFPTEVQVQDRTDGQYFTFHRTYTPRRWAYVQYFEDKFFHKDIQELGAKPIEELNHEERRKIVQAFASVEAHKQLTLADHALAKCDPDLEVEDRLAARQALLEVYRRRNMLGGERTVRAFGEEMLAPVDAAAPHAPHDVDLIIGRCGDLEEAKRDACFDEEIARLLADAHDAFVGVLRDRAGYDQRDLARFHAAYDRAERYHGISNDLGGQQFEVVVTLPGTIVAHNGDEVEVDDQNNTSAVLWRFDGRAFRDRKHELIAVSRFQRDAIKPVRTGDNDGDR